MPVAVMNGQHQCVLARFAYTFNVLSFTPFLILGHHHASSELPLDLSDPQHNPLLLPRQRFYLYHASFLYARSYKKVPKHPHLKRSQLVAGAVFPRLLLTTPFKSLPQSAQVKFRSEKPEAMSQKLSQDIVVRTTDYLESCISLHVWNRFHWIQSVWESFIV